MGPDPQDEMAYNESMAILNDNMEDTEKKVQNSMDQKKRMQRIIEVCEINKIQNEEWIRGLNFY